MLTPTSLSGAYELAQSPKVKDLSAARAFVELLIGTRPLGVAGDGEEIRELISSEIQAHLKAVLGDDLPTTVTIHTVRTGKLLALCAYLRSITDVLQVAYSMSTPK